VHSLKDMSTILEPGIELAAVLKREDPSDALVSRDGRRLAELGEGARVGTSSLRRRAFLARARPDLRLLELRGNVPTRIERLERGEYEAIVLAAAGLRRLGLEGHISELLPADIFPPAVSQGAIGVCVRTEDAEAARWVRRLDDPATRLATTAERALLRTIEGGCQVPLGALGTLKDQALQLHATVCALDGSASLRAQGGLAASLVNATRLGEQIAQELLRQGAARLIASERAARNQVEEP